MEIFCGILATLITIGVWLYCSHTHELETCEPDNHELGTHEPETHEPETHEPETHEPETHEPKIPGPENSEPEIREPEIRHFHDLDNCKEILRCTGVNEAINSIESLTARAWPNKRLAVAFGINNAFTTTNSGRHTGFRSDAKKRLPKVGGDTWTHVAKFSLDLVDRETVDDKSAFRLVPFVQSLSLKISLFILFGLNPLELDNEVASDLASGINELWVASKWSKPDAQKILPLQQRVKKALVGIFSNQNLEEEDAPMNFILPAYETLWRVVLRLFLEVTFRNPDKAPDWRNALSLFLEDLVLFEKPTPTNGAIAVSHLVNEALRLYPPTRRVYRTFLLSPESKPETVAADIERCQRDGNIWGQNSLEFEPERWISVSERQKEYFMPFGGSKFQCPAKSGFGQRIIGLLVAAMTKCITAEKWELNSDGKEQVLSGEPLDSDRMAYETLSLTRIHSQLHNT